MSIASGYLWSYSVKHIVGHYYSYFFLKMLSWCYRETTQQLYPFAVYLENELFPNLREAEYRWIIFDIVEKEGNCYLQGQAGEQIYPFLKTGRLAERLHNAGINRLRLETRLESGQITELLLLVLYALNDDRKTSLWNFSSKWKKEKVREMMRSPTGLHQSCGLVRLDLEENDCEIEYHYCELFYSRIIRGYLEKQKEFQDHRSLFYKSSKFGFIAFVVLIIPAFLELWFPGLSTVYISGMAIIGAFVIWFLIHVIASIRYDWEYYKSLNKDYVTQISLLSHFPTSNPNPVLRLNLDGNILYANPTVKKMLREMKMDDSEAYKLLPSNIADIIPDTHSSGKTQCEVEVPGHDRVIQYTISLFHDKKTAFAMGTDITQLRKTEKQLRYLNNNLESMVDAKTEELQKTQDVTILSLAGLAEIRDPETGEHLERTRLYVTTLAQQLRNHPLYRDYIDDFMIQDLYKSTPLHDIGKVGISDSILLKPGKLTKEEFQEMKNHTLYGANALRWAEERLGFDSFLSLAKEIANYHHERWDGKGYPEGLRGDDIPLSARLMSLADVYDALRSKRVYKDAYSHEKTKEIIVQGCASQFDPDVVDAFLFVENQFEDICNRYSDPECSMATKYFPS